MTYEDPITLNPATLREWISACAAAREALDDICDDLHQSEEPEIPLVARLGRVVDDMGVTLRVAEGHSPMPAKGILAHHCPRCGMEIGA